MVTLAANIPVALAMKPIAPEPVEAPITQVENAAFFSGSAERAS
jgi:hypothetical protein